MLTQYGRPLSLAVASLAFTLTMIPAAVPAVAQSATATTASDSAARNWLQRQLAAYDGGSTAAPVGAPDMLTAALASWDWLRRVPRTGAEPPLAAQAEFLRNHADWPAARAIRIRAEAQASDPKKSSDSDARAFFQQIAPQSATGLARFAMLSTGAAADRLAHAAWAAGPGLSEEQEADLLGRFGAGFTAAENAAHIDSLIWVGQVTAARRLLNWIEGDARRLAEARIALRTNAANADALYNALSAQARNGAGVTYDRAVWLERQGRLADAEALLAAGNTTAGATAPLTWLRKRLAMGRAAMRRGDHQTAYRILANHNAYVKGTDLTALPLSERVALSDSEWLAGWIALRKLSNFNAAQTRFAEFNKSVLSPISRSRGDYWLGRAEQARGDKTAAQTAFQRAARFSDYYYGQLAAEELGRAPTLPMVPRSRISAQDQARFEAKPLVAALKLLAGLNDDARTALFVRAVASAVETPTEALAAAELSKRLRRPDLGVWTWKEGRGRGDVSTFATAYPELPDTAAIPTGDWIIAHAIARQESSFNQTAVSPAGARGLMQLMPATARDVAGRLGLGYSQVRLTSDPIYNIQLGSWYINRRRDDFQNAMLAIAAYNAGAGNVRKWLNAYGDPRRPDVDAIDWVEMIPFEETRNYVQRVIENAVVYSLIHPDRAGAIPKASNWLRRG